ncbi:MAG: bifunctional adenosylcobinamide kinase/adenosylcobinamide-phosphate guanylyltransferase [Pseudomonadota bacterium]
MKELILGGARSGKSALAEQRAQASGLEVSTIATAEAGDAEMAARIAMHRARRPDRWRLVEEPVALAAVLRQEAAAKRCVIVDCLTLWLSNLLGADSAPVESPSTHRDVGSVAVGRSRERLFLRERAALLDALPGLPGHIILISNEVGMGIVPLGSLSRRFCDEAGRLHQDLARVCDRVILTVAGLPYMLKGDRL